MKLIESSVEIIPQLPGLEGIYKQIEIGGRTAYRSEDKITNDSAERFVKMLESKKHGSVLEQGTVYLKMQSKGDLEIMNKICWYRNNPHSFVRSDDDGVAYITTNYRVIIEHDKQDDLKYLCEPETMHEKRVSVRFTCSRSIAQEITRHRVASVTMESQRYCGYHKNKFNGEIVFIVPEWVKLRTKDIEHAPTIQSAVERSTHRDKSVLGWHSAMLMAENYYMGLIEKKLKPEEARSVLPNDCKTELVVTMSESQWKHFFELRCSPAAHPDIRVLADKLNKEMVEI